MKHRLQICAHPIYLPSAKNLMWSLHRAIRGNLMFLRIKNLDLAYNENHKSIYDAILGLAYLNHVSSNKLGSPLHLLPALYLRLFHTFETHKFLRLLKCITFSFLFFLYFLLKRMALRSTFYHYISSFY